MNSWNNTNEKTSQKKTMENVEEKKTQENITSASLSKRAKSSLSILTKSWALYVEEMAVNPTISAYSMLVLYKAKVGEIPESNS